ncbi:RmlC-like cupin, partial [Thelephora ganbajun]
LAIIDQGMILNRDPPQFVFDFNSGVGLVSGAGGNITVANLADFPYLLGKGMSLTVGKMAPCGLSTPHYHPRATEFLYMLTGSELKVGFLLENGVRLVTNVLKPGQGAIFPKGSFHYQVNTDCEPVTFVAGLNSEDPGVSSVAQRFFGIQPAVVDATLGDVGLDEVVRIAQSVSTALSIKLKLKLLTHVPIQIPDTFALGVQSCLDKCKIQRGGDQPKKQQQP